jgi:outer membrane lipoprotein-sorting protein
MNMRRMSLRLSLKLSLRLLVFLCLGLAYSGCVSQYKVVVEFSPSLQGHFTDFPTIEVDIAAVTDSEADEVKQAGIEKYFAPDSGMRERLLSQTCFFSREDNSSFVLPSRAQVWQSWLLKEPTNILVIASLPHDPSISAGSDPRQLLVKMKKSYVFARTIYILVEPRKVIQSTRSRSKSKSDKPETYDQWVEPR